MAKVIYAPQARKDLKAVGRFTRNRWGKNQRNKYLNQLETRILDLAENPGMGRIKSDLKNAPRCYHEGRHVIFFQESPEGIEIIRILHDSMDFERHL